MGINQPSRSIGPWAMPKDVGQLEDGQIVR